MSRRKILKLLHLVSTAWFTLSGGYILAFALWQAGKSWWVIVSLSGYSALIVFLLISLYLFAIFRGVSRSQKTQIEHPLTASIYYLVFYDTSPFLGGFAGGLGAMGLSKVTDHLLMVAVGSFWATFLVWIIVDPVAGLAEMLLRSAREHRRKRLAQAKAMREQERLTKQRLLAEVQAKEELERVRWGKVLRPYAEKLAALAASGETAGMKSETEAVDIGVRAWQMGGLNCMRQLYSMAMEICGRKCQNTTTIDYISIWWDGIGSWRNKWLEGEVSQL
jgi:hypothetical protein